MRKLRTLAQRDEETGAIAVLVGLLAVVLFAVAAIAVDVSSLAMERQKLHDHVDSAAHAGAFELPSSGASAKTWAVTMAKSQDPGMNPSTELYCVVASTGASKTVAAGQIPATCDPGVYNSSQVRCNTKICSIPCPATARCNTIKVSDTKIVPYSFAPIPIIGQKNGSTGSVSSAACKGSCGDTVPNPMDIVFMADRTTSMSDADRELMKTAIVDSLSVMDPALHYVAFGALHKSKATASCATAATTSSDGVKGGTWIPLPFNNTYKANRDAAVSTTNALVKGIKCLPNSAVPGLSTGSYGTHLASAMKGATRYLLGLDPNNLSSLPKRAGTPKKVVIFETDGMPDELLDEGSTSLTTSGDLGAGRNSYGSTNGKEGCDNLKAVADQAKNRGVTVIMIGFGDARSASCEKGGNRSPYVRDYLAASASPTASGAPSKADNDCSSTAERDAENKDGDYYFCAASGSELASIFATAIIAVTESIRLVELP